MPDTPQCERTGCTDRQVYRVEFIESSFRMCHAHAAEHVANPDTFVYRLEVLP